MKCPECGRIVREVGGKLIEHYPCNARVIVRPQRRRRQRWTDEPESYGDDNTGMIID